MISLYEEHHLQSGKGIFFMDITPLVSDFVTSAEVYSGQVTIFSKHTTVAVVVNEMESRLIQDLRTYLGKLAPSGDGYLHNDLDKRAPPPGTC
jgi:thiamine phosphate synthase YjbQ (UPF0047 family)